MCVLVVKVQNDVLVTAIDSWLQNMVPTATPAICTYIEIAIIAIPLAALGHIALMHTPDP